MKMSHYSMLWIRDYFDVYKVVKTFLTNILDSTYTMSVITLLNFKKHYNGFVVITSLDLYIRNQLLILKKYIYI